jgi:hypothetical protein
LEIRLQQGEVVIELEIVLLCQPSLSFDSVLRQLFSPRWPNNDNCLALSIRFLLIPLRHWLLQIDSHLANNVVEQPQTVDESFPSASITVLSIALDCLLSCYSGLGFFPSLDLILTSRWGFIFLHLFGDLQHSSSVLVFNLFKASKLDLCLEAQPTLGLASFRCASQLLSYYILKCVLLQSVLCLFVLFPTNWGAIVSSLLPLNQNCLPGHPGRTFTPLRYLHDLKSRTNGELMSMTPSILPSSP